jgi:hypothetical protein
MGIRIFSTQEELLDNLIAEAKEIVPTCHIFEGLDIHRKNKSYILIDKLENKDKILGQWLLRQCLLLGWEVFQASNPNGSEPSYHLRKQE